MAGKVVQYMMWWGPYLVGLLCVVFAAVLKQVGREASVEDRLRADRAVGLVLAAVALAAAFILIGIYTRPPDLAWQFAAVFLLGGAAALICSVFGELWPSGRLAASSSVLFAVGVSLTAMAFFRNYFREAPMLYLFAAALGMWLVAVLLCGGLRSGWKTGAYSCALLGSVLAGACALGIYHYPDSPSGSLFAVDFCALTLLLGLLMSTFGGTGGRAGWVTGWGGAILLLALIWWLGPMLSKLTIAARVGAYCGLSGAAAAFLAYVVAACAAGEEEDRSTALTPAEAGVLVVIIAVACLGAAMRWLAAYGVALAAVGAISVVPLMCVIRNRSPRASSQTTSDPAAAAAVLAAALAGVSFARILGEATGLHGGSLNMFETYTLPGLVLGVSLVGMLCCLGESWAKSANQGAFAVFGRGCGVVLLGCGIVLASAYFWRLQGVSGLVIGVGAGLFYMLLSVSREGRADCYAGLSLGFSMFAAALVPSLLKVTANLTRAQKIHVLVWVLGVAAILLILWSGARAVKHAREAGAARSAT